MTRTPPPPFAQVDGGGCYREKFFYFFYSRLDSCFDSVFQIILFNYFDSIKVRHLILDFIQNICSFNSLQVVTRHSSSVSFYIYHVWISRFQILNFDSFFTRINFDLFQHCRFYALTLQLFISLTLLLVINKHLCLYKFVLCLFWLF